MTDPRAQRLEQVLAQNPASTAFVELAKVLIASGDFARAADVCQSGLLHHPRSIIGRVLWGKALIQLGRPAEAMEQFDQAVAVDRENPHTYQLVAEVLLHRGLFRSALPILKRVLSLEPNNARIKGWLEHTQRALSGGITPLPLLAELEDSLAPSENDSELPDETQFPADDAQAAAPAEDTQPQAKYPQPEPGGAAPTPEAAPQRPWADEEPDAPPVLHPVPLASKVNGAADGEKVATLAAGRPSEVEVEVAEAAEEVAGNEVTEIAPSPYPFEDEASSIQPFRVANAPHRPSKRSLLSDLPENPETATVIVNIPKAELSASAAKAIAEEYERDLHKKLEHTRRQKTFLQRHGGKLAVISVLTFAALAGGAAFFHTTTVNRGRTLSQALAEARQDILKDTEISYRAALEKLEVALRMDDSSEDAWALRAYAGSLLFAEYGGASEDKARAQEALAKRGVEGKFPGLALAARYYLADAKSKDEARKDVLSSKLEQSEVQELAGRILEARREPGRAAQRFKRAVNSNANNARALVAFGNHFREAGDCQNALAFYLTAGLVSPQHPERAIGAAECRLQRSEDLEDAIKEIEAIPTSTALAPDLMARKELIFGRLLSASGRHAEATRKLSEGAKSFRTRAFEFEMALGEAERASGDYQGAQKAFEAALKARPQSEEGKEALGRVLIARDREADALERLPSEPDARKVALVRGAAYAKLADWKRARSELSKTQLNGKFPSEAVIYLALADAAEGRDDRAQEALEKALGGAKKAKSEIRVALGQVYWKRGALDKARSQFEEASKDPLEYEGACALGRLLASLGETEAAIGALSSAAARNPSHGEAQHALGRAYLAVGKGEDAVKVFSAWQADNPNAAGVQKDLALALFQTGKLKESDQAVSRASKSDGADPEVSRIRARILFAKGDPQGAFSALQRANKLDPKSPETFCEIGRAFMRQGNIANASKAFEAALREDARNACGRTGAVLVRLPAGGKSAVKELSEVAERAPTAWDRAEAKAALARALLAMGSLKEARKEAEESAQVEPQLSDGHLSVGLVATKQKDDDRAKEALFRAEALDPANAEVHLSLGDLLARSGTDWDRAYQEYQLFLRTGTDPSEHARIKRLLPTLKKKLAAR